MFVDLLNSYNYLMVNMDAIRIFGLHSAVYIAELLNIYKKAKLKKKLIETPEGSFFKVDRKYIAERTSLSVEDQLACDINLAKVNIVTQYNNEADTIKFDVELFASLIANEDVKLVSKVIKAVKVDNPKGVKATKREHIIQNLKEGIVCKNQDLLFALRGWVDAIFAGPSPYLSKPQIDVFQKTMNEYCKGPDGKGDLDLALKIVEIATVHAWKDCQWAINSYEGKSPSNNSTSTTAVRTTKQEKATRNTINEDIIF